MVGIFDPACKLLPLYLLSDLPPFLNKMYSIYRQCGLVGGGGVLSCDVDHILQEFYTLFLTRFRTYKIVSPPQTKMTSKDDIKGLVSLKFLRPCCDVTGTTRPAASTLGRSAGSCSRAPSLHMRKNTISGQYSYLLCSLIFSSILSVSPLFFL